MSAGLDDAGPVEACVFDAYGTLLDIHSAVAGLSGEVGPRADELSALWRRKQLEYSWLRSLMRRHADFRQVTRDALDHALDALGIGDGREELRSALLEAYGRLSAYPEVPEMLRGLRARGVRAAVLSNGSPTMLAGGFAAAGLAGLLDPVLSVEDAGVFKPAPEVYLLPCRALGLPAGRIAFFSSNGWDMHGAASFGFATVWVNRAGLPRERLPGAPTAVVRDLSTVPDLLGRWAENR